MITLAIYTVNILHPGMLLKTVPEPKVGKDDVAEAEKANPLPHTQNTSDATLRN